MAGFAFAFRNEAAFRQELALFAAGTALAVWLARPLWQTALMVASLGLVLVVELLNSAIEAIVDRASPERHPLAGAAKDLGSAAVLVSLVVAALVWLGLLSIPT